MLPSVALVGRPNVGKSTLFNRLTRSRAALVADEPGVTRDRIYGTAVHERRRFLVVDTGGLGGDDERLSVLSAEQTHLAAEEADLIVFIVDARSGVTAADQSIAQDLRRLGRPLLLVVNKSEGLDPAIAVAEFQTLGLGEPQAVSAEHGEGIEDLFEGILARLTFPPPEAAETPAADLWGPDSRRILVTLIGRPNVGKSTLANRLLGEERMIASETPGTTRDSVFIPFDSPEGRFTLIDTAGIRRRSRLDAKVEKFSVLKSLQAMTAAHVVVLLVDAREGITDQDAHLAGLVLESGRAIIIAVNKWDKLAVEQRRRVEQELDRKLGFLPFAPVHFISALHGTGVGLLLEEAARVYQAATKQLSTPRLTRILHEALKRHPPPAVGGRRIRLRYAHQGGQNPPTIVIHGNQTGALPGAYRRYLANTFREALALSGTPVRIELRSGKNPYVGGTLEDDARSQRRRAGHYLRRRRQPPS